MQGQKGNYKPMLAETIPSKHDKTEKLGKTVPVLGIPESSRKGQKTQSVSGNKTHDELSMPKAKSSDFKSGEAVCVTLDKDVVKVMNEGYDAYRDEIQEVLFCFILFFYQVFGGTLRTYCCSNEIGCGYFSLVTIYIRENSKFYCINTFLRCSC